MVIFLKTAVQIGAGKIGRGFMAQIFHDSGYKVVFIDVNEEIIKAVNTKGSYNLLLVDNQGKNIRKIDGISAVFGGDLEAAEKTVAQADIMAVAVGVGALRSISPIVAGGMRHRWRRGNYAPLNLFICENLMNASEYFRGILHEIITSGEERNLLRKTLGLIETSVGRMVPESAGAHANPLDIIVEPYCQLPADRSGFVGEVPDLKCLTTFSPFIFYIRRKLYLHNFGHVVFAYLGQALGREFIWEVVEDEDIYRLCHYTLEQVARGLAAEHHAPITELTDHIDDLLKRFANRALGDTVKRVGWDLRRKLGPNDRIIGAYRFLTGHKLDTSVIPLVIACALRFSALFDQERSTIQQIRENDGISGALKEICGLRPEEIQELLPQIEKYERLLAVDPKMVFKNAANLIPRASHGHP